MTLLSDWQITQLAFSPKVEPVSDAAEGVPGEPEPLQWQQVIYPFYPMQLGCHGERKIISYGLSSYGYDIRLSPLDFRVFRHIPGTVIDPKNFNPDNLETVDLHKDKQGQFFILPAHSYGLGVAVERLDLPRNISAICLGKSTYARAGIIVNMTPAEAGWCGHLTLELSNASSADCRIYANEGIAQLLFFKGSPCEVSYSDRNGKYQDQDESVVLARV